MNQRIRELAHEAGLPTYNPEGIPTKLEKFAELIVRECISCVGSQADKAYLKKHFGLQVESDIIYPATDESWSVETQYKRKYNLAPGPEDIAN
jgi:NAD-dependent oxidoreductase involved in siderophore biosynthesis